MIHQVVSEIWVFRMGSTILEHPVFFFMITDEQGKTWQKYTGALPGFGKGGGGAFLKEWDNCEQPWPEFSFLLNQIQTVYPKLRRIFWPKSEIQTVLPAELRQLLHSFGTKFFWGVAVFISWTKIGPKALKTSDFAYFSGQWGGVEPPVPPGYATENTCEYIVTWNTVFCFFSVLFSI